MILLKLLSKIEGKRLQVSQMAIDHQLKHLAVYDVNQDCVYLLTPIMVLHYMLEYRSNFENNHQYALTHSLPFHKAIRGTRGSSVFRMFFSTSAKDKDQLVLVYYDGSVQIYENHNNWTHSASCSLSNRIIGATLTSDNILYAVDFNNQVEAYNLGLRCTPVKSEVKQAKCILEQTKEGLIYEDQGGALVRRGNILLPAQANKPKFYHRYQSVDEEEIEPENYEVSKCKRYLIRYRPCTVYDLHTKASKFQTMLNFKGQPCGVYPSPFNYKVGSVAAVAYSGSLDFVVLVPNPQQKAEQGSVVLQIVELKEEPEKIVWISPYSLLILNIDERLFYLQINSSQLQVPGDVDPSDQ